MYNITAIGNAAAAEWNGIRPTFLLLACDKPVEVELC
jgi:hypothetical protein